MTPKDLRASADRLDKLNDNAIAIYANRSGQDPVTVAEAMDAETWYNAKEAKAAGFIDEVVANKTIVAIGSDFSQFTNVPGWAEDFRAQSQIQQKDEDMSIESPQTELDAEASAKIIEDARLKGVADAEAKATVDAEAKAAIETAVKAERDRMTQIAALCGQAGQSDLTAGFCEDASTTVADVQNKLFSVLCEANQPVGDGGGAGDVSGELKSDDPNAAFKAEYKGEASYQASMSEAEFVTMRRIDEGLSVLSAGSDHAS